MSAVEGRIRMPDGTGLRTLRWEATGTRGRVLLVHGLGDHAARYGELAGVMNDAGLSVYAFDLRGHGRSDGPRGHTPSFERLLGDVDGVRSEVEREHAEREGEGRVPLFLLGHSLGGLLVIRYLQERERPCAAAVASAPWLGTDVPAWKRWLARIADPIWPSLPVSNPIALEELTADTAMQRERSEDPLIHFKVTPRMFRAAEAAQRKALERADRIEVPLLVLLAEADRVVRGSTTRRWAESAGGAVTLRPLPGRRHEPFHDVGRREVAEATAAWLVERARAEHVPHPRVSSATEQPQ